MTVGGDDLVTNPLVRTYRYEQKNSSNLSEVVDLLQEYLRSKG